MVLTNIPFLVLLTTVKKDGTMKRAKLLEEVDNPNYRADRGSRYRLEKIPLGVVAVAGDKSIEKRDLVNAMLVDWQIDLKMAHKPKGERSANITLLLPMRAKAITARYEETPNVRPSTSIS